MIACKECEYFGRVDVHSGAKMGVCRVIPPVTFVMNDGRLTTRFPVVSDDDWCGQWDEKEC